MYMLEYMSIIRNKENENYEIHSINILNRQLFQFRILFVSYIRTIKHHPAMYHYKYHISNYTNLFAFLKITCNLFYLRTIILDLLNVALFLYNKQHNNFHTKLDFETSMPCNF
ncbi:hypothetical protein V1478_012888 [Vespula squamosa]|uniref:Uncharacterized protein n=1 Tax=Vespula squamosa TaxID=30214 RepID=A0ABD2A993_VESSQ